MNHHRLLRAGSPVRGRIAGVALPILLTWCALASPIAHAQAARTQTLRLGPGWNAAYLEVDPLAPDPSVLFAEHPVDIVAAYAASQSGAQFVSNPLADVRGSYGWAVWYAPNRPDAFLTRLYSLNGATAYLVHATTNTVVEITGRVPPVLQQWQADAYNLVGFAVQDPGAPTFAQFFGSSPAHNHNKIYRMVNGTWRQVLDPGAETLRSGEAFWIYCQGRSDYVGPLEVAASSPFGVNLATQGDQLVFRNRTAHPISFSVEHVTDPSSPVPLSAPVQVIDAEAEGMRTLNVPLGDGNWQQDFPPLEAGKAIRLPLALRTQDIAPGVRYSLIRVVSDLGTLVSIPVTATRDDLP